MSDELVRDLQAELSQIRTERNLLLRANQQIGTQLLEHSNALNVRGEKLYAQEQVCAEILISGSGSRSGRDGIRAVLKACGLEPHES